MIPYKIKLIHRVYHNDETLVRTDLYKFKTRFDRVYFIIVEVFKLNVYAIKFHLRIHKNLSNKYQIEINDGDAFRILSTCIDMARIILSEDELASFGFIGQNSIGEKLFKTQRYRVYSNLAKRYFNPKNFSHNKDENNSIYFLGNCKNKLLDVSEVNKTITEYYIFPTEEN